MRESSIKRVIIYVIACLYAIVCIFPILMMLLSSLKPNIEIFKNPLGLSSKLSFVSYEKLFVNLNYASYIKNSVFTSVSAVALVVICAVLVSYYIARFNFKWNGVMFFYFLIGMMLPLKLGLVPLFMLMKDLNLINNLGSVIFVLVAAGLPFAVLLLTGFFRTLPKELEEAARIDGASNAKLLVKVIVPLMKPAISTVAIINFIGAWNDFFFPLIFIHDTAKKTIPIGMLQLFSEFTTDWSVLFAGLTLSSLPMIIIFFFASKQFMDGLTAGAVK